MTEGIIHKWQEKQGIDDMNALTFWIVGDTFSAGDVLLELETWQRLKSTWEAPEDGILAKIVVRCTYIYIKEERDSDTNDDDFHGL